MTAFDAMARHILHAALDEDRAGELLECLFDRGSCTVDADGHLVLVRASVISAIAEACTIADGHLLGPDGTQI